MKIHDVKQNSPEWLALRLGVVTASEMDALVTPLWKLRTGEGVETFLYRKVCEKAIGWMPEQFGGYFVDNGHMAEKVALPWYNFTFNAEARTVGFVTSDDGKIGCSPDALIGDEGGMEIKYPAPPTHLKYLMKNEVPPEYRAQVHFSMLVTGRPWWKFVSFSTQLDPLVVHVDRDEKIQAVLREAVDAFFERFDPIYTKIKGTKDADNAAFKAAYEEKIRAWEAGGPIP